MVNLVLLAGGSGTRMNNKGLPKQFLNINDKPIIIETLERIIEYSIVDRYIVVCNNGYLKYLNDLIVEYELDNYRIDIISGGNSRLESAINGCKHINEKYGCKEDDLVLVHDAVRPFISKRLIEENIKNCLKYGASSTASSILETVIKTDNDNNIISIFKRNNLFSDQSPQAFKLNTIINCSEKIPFSIMSEFTDLAEIYSYFNLPVKVVIGERENIKITTPIDLVIATSLIKNIDED